MIIRNHTDLSKLKSFEERYKYLQLNSIVGENKFGFERFLNQNFYTSSEWKSIRDKVIIRDNGCDLGIEGREIFGKIFIHHMNPITSNDILSHNDLLVDPEYLICTSFETHNAIHYGDANLLIKKVADRKPNDTRLW